MFFLPISLVLYLIIGCAETRAGPVTLDFAAGLIRHAAIVDEDGVEWSDEVVRQLRDARLSSSGMFIAHDSWFYILHVAMIITNTYVYMLQEPTYMSMVHASAWSLMLIHGCLFVGVP